MAPHLSLKELDLLRHWCGALKLSPVQIHAKLEKRRTRAGIATPDLTNLRKVLKGTTYKLGAAETRGAKRTLTLAHVKRMNKTRKTIIKKVGNTRQVVWAELVEKSDVPKVDPSTAAKNFQHYGIDVRLRPCREKPQRTTEHVQERYRVTGRWRFLSEDYFLNDVDMILDNKGFDVPTTQRARDYLKRQKVHSQLRTRGEGLKAEFTKPNQKKHRINPGGALRVCAGICGDRIVVWEYIKGNWNGQKAADLYKEVIHPSLLKHRGLKKKGFTVLEDNDPVGYKSGKGKRAKKECRINAIEFPRYSPDLNPLDQTFQTSFTRLANPSEIF